MGTGKAQDVYLSNGDENRETVKQPPSVESRNPTQSQGATTE